MEASGVGVQPQPFRHFFDVEGAILRLQHLEHPGTTFAER
jgi:hypothetical protein